MVEIGVNSKLATTADDVYSSPAKMRICDESIDSREPFKKFKEWS